VNDDTIAAIATGGIVSAIGVIRMSGPRAIEIADHVFRPSSGGNMRGCADRLLRYGQLLRADGAVMDLCLCTVSRAPHSYTGEDTVEFQCHGSPTVLAEGLRSVFAAGARQALAGEFTKRAFLNGRMDLTQAEAVIDLIESETSEAAVNAAGQLAGVIRTKIESVYVRLLDIIAHFFAVIDYPDDGIDAFEIDGYVSVMDGAVESLRSLLGTFERGSVLKNGVPAVIIGRPNVGKSSVLNALLGYDRAIVADVAGTTRDTIEEKIKLGGVLLRLTDTAGIRDASDGIELQGVLRAREAAGTARLSIAVFDGSSSLTHEDAEVSLLSAGAEARIAVINKSDLPQVLTADDLPGDYDAVCRMSALTGAGIDSLISAAAGLFGFRDVPSGETVTNPRHADAIGRALAGIVSAKDALAAGVTYDAALSELESALSALGEITGATIRNDLTARIFERFCVGK
jgi:tRNA modification GTPase